MTESPESPEAVRPEALWFGRDRSTSFGMLHHPEGSSTRGVIFCNTLGFDGLLAHLALRHLAEDLADRGFWALRFDYDGEGDSAGAAWDPQRVDAWMASIDAAVGVLRARGVTHVHLVGFRLGASLACRYATSHPGVSSLVMWSPIAKGAAYKREMRALSRLSAVARPVQRVSAAWFPDDALEVAGFDVSGETLRDIAEIDLIGAPHPACPPSVLVVDRDDAPANDDLVRKFVDSGAHVEHHLMSGYEDFMTESGVNSTIPWTTLHRITEWIAETVPADEPVVVGGAPVECESLAISDSTAGLLAIDVPTCGVVERPVWIADRFFAIVSSPHPDAPSRGAAIVLANTGSLNRSGPGRLHVHLARFWAGLGFTVVRVDLGGCGDTAADTPEAANEVLGLARADELAEIVNWVRTSTGLDRVAAGGLCSAAFDAFHAALNGLDLDTLLLVNPGTFYVGSGSTSVEETMATAHFLTRGFLNGRKWKLALRDRDVRRRGVRSVRRLFRKKPISGMRVLAVESLRNSARRIGLPVKSTSALARDLEAIIARGSKVLMVFSAGEPAAQYLRTVGGPACDALAAGDGLDVVNIDGGDHVFASSGGRRVLVERLTAYLEGEYPPGLAIPTTRTGSGQTRALIAPGVDGA